MSSSSLFRWTRIASAVVLAVAAVFHIVQAAGGHGSVLRHAVFVPINAGLAALLVFKPRWAFWPTLALTIQQMASHGLDLSRSFLGTEPLDWVALAVCLFFPTLATVLFIERQEQAEAEAEADAKT